MIEAKFITDASDTHFQFSDFESDSVSPASHSEMDGFVEHCWYSLFQTPMSNK